jgi:hypothetical protein
MAAARELVIGDEPAAWARLGFAPGEDGAFALGGLRLRLAGRAAGSGVLELRVEGLAGERPDGLPLLAAERERGQIFQTSSDGRWEDISRDPGGGGAVAPDRTTAALAASGGDVRRRGEPPELPAPMAFVRFGELIVEVAEAAGQQPRFWGVTIVVPDLDALAGPLLGAARPAVQPGRRIATVSRAAGLSVALALITPV